MRNQTALLFLLSILSSHAALWALDSSEALATSDDSSCSSEIEQKTRYFVVVSDNSKNLTSENDRAGKIAETVKMLVSLKEREFPDSEIKNFPYPEQKDWVVSELSSDIEFSVVTSNEEDDVRIINASLKRNRPAPITLVLSQNSSEDETTYFANPEGFVGTFSLFKKPGVIFFLKSCFAFPAISRSQSNSQWLERQLAERRSNFFCSTVDPSKAPNLTIQMVKIIELAGKEYKDQ